MKQPGSLNEDEAFVAYKVAPLFCPVPQQYSGSKSGVHEQDKLSCLPQQPATCWAKVHHSASSVLQLRLGFEVFDHKVLTKQCFKQGYMGKDSVLSSRLECLEM